MGNATATAALGNHVSGVLIDEKRIRRTRLARPTGSLNASSLRLGKRHYGVELSGAGTSSNVVLGNYIGTNLTGTIPIANTRLRHVDRHQLRRAT